MNIKELLLEAADHLYAFGDTSLSDKLYAAAEKCEEPAEYQYRHKYIHMAAGWSVWAMCSKWTYDLLSSNPPEDAGYVYEARVVYLAPQPAQVPEGWPTDDMVILGAEVLADSLRQHGVAIEDTQIEQDVAEAVFAAMLDAAPQALPTDGPHISCWALRDVYFDEEGQPIMHKAPQPEGEK